MAEPTNRPDPKTVERVAAAIVGPIFPWELVSNKDRFRRKAEAAIRAMMNDKEAGERG